ncbi:MAG TPA: hypothetical protein VF221_23180 [Chloroflexota bacterium]
MNAHLTSNGTIEASSARRQNRSPARPVGLAAGLCLVQLVLAYEWLMSGINKLLNPNFTAQLASNLQQNMTGNPYIWYAGILRQIVLPRAGVFGVLTELGELSIGVTLLASAVLWLRRPNSRLTLHVGKAACLALAGSIFLPLNFFLMSGDPIPWINSANAFNEGVSIDAFIAMLAVTLLLTNLRAVRAATQSQIERGMSWAA